LADLVDTGPQRTFGCSEDNGIFDGLFQDKGFVGNNFKKLKSGFNGRLDAEMFGFLVSKRDKKRLSHQFKAWDPKKWFCGRPSKTLAKGC
jgi:hypothetical protein